MTTAGILARLPNLSVLIIGDICLDRWCDYDPAEAEPSRETGIPRTAVVSSVVTPGAGGTIANNLAAMGVGRVSVIGAVGDDGFGYELRRALAARGIGSDGLVNVEGLQTFTYTKLLNRTNGVEDLPRIDFINTAALAPAAEARLIAEIEAAVPSHDVIIVSDQAETSRGGVVTSAVRDAVCGLGPRHAGKVFVADSRARVEHFRNVIVKPNQQEGEEACRRAFGRVDYAALRAQTQAPLLAVTHGGDGVLLLTDRGEQWVRTRKVDNPVDICGAGDSFCAGMSAALSVTGSPAESVRFGNLIASITIMKKGTGTASPQEILDASARD